MRRATSLTSFLKAASARLNFSASAACLAVTLACSVPASARSLRMGAASRTDLPKSSCTTRALLASSAKPARARAVCCRASTGSARRRAATSTLMARSAWLTAFVPSASLSTWLNLTMMPPTASSVVPVVRAKRSSLLISSTVEPVASARSFMASTASTADLSHAAMVPTDSAAASCGPRALKASPTFSVLLSSSPRLRTTPCRPPCTWLAPCRLSRMPICSAMVLRPVVQRRAEAGRSRRARSAHSCRVTRSMRCMSASRPLARRGGRSRRARRR